MERCGFEEEEGQNILILFTALLALIPLASSMPRLVPFLEWSQTQTINGCVVWIIPTQYWDLTRQWLSSWIDAGEVGVDTAAFRQLYKAWTATKPKYRISCWCIHPSYCSVPPSIVAAPFAPWTHLHSLELIAKNHFKGTRMLFPPVKKVNEKSLCYFCSALRKSPIETLIS